MLLHSINRDLFVNRDDSLMSERVIMRTEQPTKCFVPLQTLRVRGGPKISLSPPSYSLLTVRR